MKSNQQQFAKDLYLHTEKTQEEIAEILNVNRKTLFLWIKKGKWNEMKLAAQQAPGVILFDIYSHIHEINKKIRSREDKCPEPEEVNMLCKLSRMSKDYAKKNTGFYMEAFEELTYFIAKDDVPLSQAVLRHMDRYIAGTFGDENFLVTKNVLNNIKSVRENLAASDAQEGDPSVTLNEVTAPQQFLGQFPYPLIPLGPSETSVAPKTTPDNLQPILDLTSPLERPGEVPPTSLPQGEGRGGATGAQTGQNGAFSQTPKNDDNKLNNNNLEEKQTKENTPYHPKKI